MPKIVKPRVVPLPNRGRRGEPVAVLLHRRRSGRTIMNTVLAVFVVGYVAWHQWIIYWHQHRVAIQHTLSWVLPSIVAAVCALLGLVLLLKSRRGAATARTATLGEVYQPGGDGSALEDAAADRLDADGWGDVVVTGGSGDMGVDVVATWPHPTRLRLCMSCKAYNPAEKLGPPQVTDFTGTVWTTHKAHIAVLVTTAAGLTAGAARVASDAGVLVLAGTEALDVLAGRRPVVPDGLIQAAIRRLGGGTATLPVVQDGEVVA